MKAAIALFVAALALLVAPARSERDLPRVAEGYATRALTTGLFELPPGDDLPSLVVDGRRRAIVGALDVAVAMPAAIVARIAPQSTAWRQAAALLLPTILLAALAMSFFVRLRQRRSVSATQALWATASLVAASGLLAALRRADATLLAALALWLALDSLAARRPSGHRHSLQLGLLCSTVVIAIPAYAGAALALVALDFIGRRGVQRRPIRALGLATLPILVAIACSRLWDAHVALSPAPSIATWHALYGLLLSPGRSLFLYTPLALLGVIGLPLMWERDRARAEGIVAVSIVALIGIASRADWHGDPAYGPSLVVPLLPLWIEGATAFLHRARVHRVVFGVAAFAGLTVQLLGISANAEAWPRLVADVRAATGAPGWFLDPAADIEFIPQLSPIAGQVTLLRLARGGDMGTPPFSLVVGSDQAEPAGTSVADQAWTDICSRFDKAGLRPNLALTEGSSTQRRVHSVIALVFTLAAVAAVARSRNRSA